MTSIVVDPFNAQTVFVGTRDAGVFKSTDGASTWNPARNGLTFYPIRYLLADPNHRNVLYAGTDYDGVYKTTDGGEHWSFSGNGIDARLIVFQLLFDPVTPSTLYAVTGGGVGLDTGHIYQSTDSGTTWQIRDTGMPRISNSEYTNGVLAIAIDPIHPTTLYAGTVHVGAFLSTDSGAHWSPIQAGLPLMASNPDTYYSFGALAIDPWHANHVSALYNGQYYVFSAGGWSKVNTSDGYVGSGVAAEHLYFHPTQANVIFAAGSKFMVSTDSGLTWEQRLGWDTSGNITAIAFHSSTPDILYAASNILMQYEGGVWKTNNQGATWTQAWNGITAPEIESLEVDLSDSSKLYAGADKSGFFYRSGDGGQTWARGAYVVNGTTDYTFGEIKDIAINPNSPQQIYLAGTNFYISNDSGVTFTHVEEVRYPSKIAIPNGVSETVYVGSIFGDGIYKSTDSGGHWTQKNTGLPHIGSGISQIFSLVTDPNNPGTLWTGTEYGGGILKTTDAGDHWVTKGLTDVHRITAIAISPANSNLILAGGGDKIYQSMDGGDTWKVVNEEIGSAMQILFDPRDPHWVYATSEGSGVLRSSDSGSHWYFYNEGIFYPVMYHATFTADDPPHLLAGSYGSGLYTIIPDISQPLLRSHYLPNILK